MPLTRRRLLSLGAAAGGALVLPSGARAASARNRRFLFVLAEGGWDFTYVFAPLFDSAYVDMDPDAAAAAVGDLAFVDAPTRPAVRRFFETWGAQAAFLNGFELRSVTHERCMSYLMTGRGDGAVDDWAAVLAGHASGGLLLPHLVLSGPSYTAAYGGSVVRMGSRGQLPDLLSGAALDYTEAATPGVHAYAEAAADAFVRSRLERYAHAARPGRDAALAAGYRGALADLDALAAASLNLQGDGDGAPSSCSAVFDQLDTAVAAMALGHARCAMVRYQGWCGYTFDSHTENRVQATHFEELFVHLEWLMQRLEATPGAHTPRLADEVVVVVLSEMGRHPQENLQAGKDHWTFTSAMLVGPGVAGGRVYGGFDEYAIGRPVDLASGQPHDGGEALTGAHLGATLLALGDVDPAPHTDGAGPVLGMLA